MNILLCKCFTVLAFQYLNIPLFEHLRPWSYKKWRAVNSAAQLLYESFPINLWVWFIFCRFVITCLPLSVWSRPYWSNVSLSEYFLIALMIYYFNVTLSKHSDTLVLHCLIVPLFKCSIIRILYRLNVLHIIQISHSNVLLFLGSFSNLLLFRRSIM